MGLTRTLTSRGNIILMSDDEGQPESLVPKKAADSPPRKRRRVDYDLKILEGAKMSDAKTALNEEKFLEKELWLFQLPKNVRIDLLGCISTQQVETKYSLEPPYSLLKPTSWPWLALLNLGTF